jgi:hypothetical protein
VKTGCRGGQGPPMAIAPTGKQAMIGKLLFRKIIPLNVFFIYLLFILGRTKFLYELKNV